MRIKFRVERLGHTKENSTTSLYYGACWVQAIVLVLLPIQKSGRTWILLGIGHCEMFPSGKLVQILHVHKFLNMCNGHHPHYVHLVFIHLHNGHVAQLRSATPEKTLHFAS
jgi:hypothetical protein